MSAPVQNITLYQCSSEDIVFTWVDKDGNPVNLTGYSAKMQIRPSVGSSTIYKTLSTSPTEGEGLIVIDPLEGEFQIKLTDEITAEFEWSYGVYDLFAIAPNAPEGDAYIVVRGRVNLMKSVTKL